MRRGASCFVNHPVSRETLPPAPAVVVDHFGDRFALVEEYARHLARDGVTRGLIGPREVVRLWDRHIANCAAVTEAVPHGATVADVGSGAGLPGLVWAIARPDLQVTLIEPLLRRTTFLNEMCDTLGLQSQVRVWRGRAAEHSDRYAVVTARAVAGLDKLTRWCVPLLEPGGVFLAFKGTSAQQELDDSRSTIGQMGATSASVTTYGKDMVLATVIEVHQG